MQIKRVRKYLFFFSYGFMYNNRQPIKEAEYFKEEYFNFHIQLHVHLIMQIKEDMQMFQFSYAATYTVTNGKKKYMYKNMYRYMHTI